MIAIQQLRHRTPQPLRRSRIPKKRLPRGTPITHPGSNSVEIPTMPSMPQIPQIPRPHTKSRRIVQS
jgi:hypothetical protein